jgi:hypothetical protein
MDNPHPPDYRTRALIWLELAKRSPAFSEQASALAQDWLTFARLQEMFRAGSDAPKSNSDTTSVSSY